MQIRHDIINQFLFHIFVFDTQTEANDIQSLLQMPPLADVDHLVIFDALGKLVGAPQRIWAFWYVLIRLFINRVIFTLPLLRRWWIYLILKLRLRRNFLSRVLAAATKTINRLGAFSWMRNACILPLELHIAVNFLDNWLIRRKLSRVDILTFHHHLI